MVEFFNQINNFFQIVKNTITQIINFIPQIFNFLTSSIDLLPTPLKMSILSIFGVLTALLIYRFLRK